MLLHKEEQSLKSANWETCASKGKLVGFDSHTIYKIYIKDPNKVIRLQNLRIFEDIISKTTTTSPDIKEKPMFDEIQIPDKQGPSDKSNVFEEKKRKPKKPSQKLSKTQVGKDANRASKREIKLMRATLQRQAKNQAGKAIRQPP